MDMDGSARAPLMDRPPLLLCTSNTLLNSLGEINKAIMMIIWWYSPFKAPNPEKFCHSFVKLFKLRYFLFLPLLESLAMAVTDFKRFTPSSEISKGTRPTLCWYTEKHQCSEWGILCWKAVIIVTASCTVPVVARMLSAVSFLATSDSSPVHSTASQEYRG